LKYCFVFTADASFFNHIMVREEQNISNWILDESGRFTLRSTRTFFLEPGVHLVFIYFVFQNSCTLESFSWETSTDQHIQNKGLHICSMCTLCEKHEESIQHLFFECSTALHIWS